MPQATASFPVSVNAAHVDFPTLERSCYDSAVQEAITDGGSNSHFQRIASATSQMRVTPVCHQHDATLLSCVTYA